MNDGDEMQINMLKSQRDVAVATEQNIRAINNDLSRELAIMRAFHKNQCQVAMETVPPESALTFIDPAQYLSAYIRLLQSELHKWRSATGSWNAPESTTPNTNTLIQQLRSYANRLGLGWIAEAADCMADQEKYRDLLDRQIDDLTNDFNGLCEINKSISERNDSLEAKCERLESYIKNQCQVAMETVPPELGLTYIDAARYLNAYIRVLQSELKIANAIRLNVTEIPDNMTRRIEMAISEIELHAMPPEEICNWIAARLTEYIFHHKPI